VTKFVVSYQHALWLKNPTRGRHVPPNGQRAAPVTTQRSQET